MIPFESIRHYAAQIVEWFQALGTPARVNAINPYIGFQAWEIPVGVNGINPFRCCINPFRC